MLRKYSKTPDKGTILVAERVEDSKPSHDQEGENGQAGHISTDNSPED